MTGEKFYRLCAQCGKLFSENGTPTTAVGLCGKCWALNANYKNNIKKFLTKKPKDKNNRYPAS